MPGIKIGNEYAYTLREFYDEIPKAVLAAIAVSAMTCGGDWLEEAAPRIANEWRILNEQGIVSQHPTRKALEAMKRLKEED